MITNDMETTSNAPDPEATTPSEEPTLTTVVVSPTVSEESSPAGKTKLCDIAELIRLAIGALSSDAQYSADDLSSVMENELQEHSTEAGTSLTAAIYVIEFVRVLLVVVSDNNQAVIGMSSCLGSRDVSSSWWADMIHSRWSTVVQHLPADNSVGSLKDIII